MNFWRILLALSSAAVGFAIGANVAASFLVSKSDGMAGGVMVLGYGAVGAIVLLVISIITGAKLKRAGKTKWLVFSAIILSMIAAAYYGWVSYRANAQYLAEAGSDADYAMAGEFTVRMERLDLSDPYLFVTMEIDSRSRKWRRVGPAPESAVFTGTLKASQLVEIRALLDEVAAIPARVLADCNSNKGPASKRLRWHLKDAKIPPEGPGKVTHGAVNTNRACLSEYPQINRALLTVEQAPLSALGDTKRE